MPEQSNHSPGPWIALGDFGFPKEIRAEATGELIATVRPNIKCGVANMHLIAAAPDMLAALEAIQVILTPSATHCHRLIQQALAKAKNEG